MNAESIAQQQPIVYAPTSHWASRIAPWIALFGTIVLLFGLGIDAILHRLNPALAESEGIFTLRNPGHFLFALGLTIVVLSGVLFLIGKLATAGSLLSRLAVVVLLLGLLATSMISCGLASKTEGSVLAGHSHDEETGGASQVAGPSSHVHFSGDPNAPVTPEQRAAAEKLAEEVKAGTARFADYAVAQQEGYRQVTPYVIPSLRGLYGPAHFVNPGYVARGNYLDPSHPAALVYFKMPDGKMLYLGAMFLAPVGKGPAPGGSLTIWHTHENLCFDGKMFSLVNLAGQCKAGSQPVPAKWEMMHVWTFDNPDGAFAQALTRDDYLAAIRQLDPGAIPNR